MVFDNTLLDIEITESFPVYVEVSTINTAGVPAYFDDLTIQNTIGPVVEENNFYAYGLRNEGLSWRRSDERNYGRGYQGQNTTQDAESGYTAFELRDYDARIGRWMSTDPMGQFDSSFTGMGNNPVSMFDNDGGEAYSDFYENGRALFHIDDGSDARYEIVGEGANKHFEFTGVFASDEHNFFINPEGALEGQERYNLTSPSLQAGGGQTHCSEAVRDDMAAYMNAFNNQYGYQNGFIKGPSANSMSGQLAKAGGAGWQAATIQQAAAFAKRGGLAVITYYNPTVDGHGHIAAYSVGSNIKQYSYMWVNKRSGESQIQKDLGILSNVGPKNYTGPAGVRRAFGNLLIQIYIYSPTIGNR